MHVREFFCLWYNCFMAIKGKKYIVGNWKMNPQTKDEAKSIARSLKKIAATSKKVEVIVCPPHVYLQTVAGALGDAPVALGVQNLSEEEKGSFTGETSALMARDFGVKYAIIGHSERRKMGETSALVAKKVAQALTQKITPIICIGEAERDTHGAFLAELKQQFTESLATVSKEQLKSIIVAYEPVWAIGKSEKEAMQPHQIHEMTIFIRKIAGEKYGQENAATFPILYGGSVGGSTGPVILNEGNVNGLLIGRQSLTEEFGTIVTYASTI